MSTHTQQHTFSGVAGDRLDQIIVAQLEPQFTRSQVQALIRAGHVTVDGKSVKAGVKMKGGEEIVVRVPPPPEASEDTVAPEPIALEVVYEDEDFAVINKPPGMVVHPGAGNRSHTLVNAILARYPEIADMHYAPSRRGIVHRLDKDTSGLILIARNSVALQRLIGQFQKRTVEKTYLALAEKAPPTLTGRIDVPIGRDPAQRKRMRAQRGGRASVTEYHVRETFEDGSALVELRPFTGRTHQIRVHMAFIHAPLVGDRTYGHRKGKRGPGRQFLHAARLCFDHPRTGERLCFEAPLAPDLEAYLDALRSGRR
jgi:23S rRNA pseudouridine1911/1915/1917 synthase